MCWRKTQMKNGLFISVSEVRVPEIEHLILKVKRVLIFWNVFCEIQLLGGGECKARIVAMSNQSEFVGTPPSASPPCKNRLLLRQRRKVLKLRTNEIPEASNTNQR
jgi:hypothetical protein